MSTVDGGKDSTASRGSIIVDEDKCISCGVCVAVCPHDALSLENRVPVTIGKCKVCGLCSSGCVTKAITMRSKNFRDDGILEKFDGSKVAVFSCRKISRDYISLMCSGRIDMSMIISAFERGAHAVLVAGCESCGNRYGSKEAEIKINTVKLILEKAGIDPERVRFVYGDFTDELKEIREYVEGLGKITADLSVIKMVTLDRVLRSLVSRKRGLVEDGNVYGERVDENRMGSLIDAVVSFSLNASRILSVLNGRADVDEIAQKTGLGEDEIVKTLIEMRRRGMLNLEFKGKIICYSR